MVCVRVWVNHATNLNLGGERMQGLRGAPCRGALPLPQERSPCCGPMQLSLTGVGKGRSIGGMATRRPCVRTKSEEREMRQAWLLTSAGFSCLDVSCTARVPPDVPSCFGFSIFFVWPSLRTKKSRATAFGVRCSLRGSSLTQMACLRQAAVAARTYVFAPLESTGLVRRCFTHALDISLSPSSVGSSA